MITYPNSEFLIAKIDYSKVVKKISEMYNRQYKKQYVQQIISGTKNNSFLLHGLVLLGVVSPERLKKLPKEIV